MNFPRLCLFSLAIARYVTAAEPPNPPPRDDAAAERLGWHLATKAYTFRAITLAETIEISKVLGVKFFEVNPGQKLAADKLVNTDQNTDSETRDEIKKRFAAAGIQPVNFGVVPLTSDEAADRKIFGFAKDLGIRTIVSEPTADSFPLLDKLCAEYDIQVAIHNHPEPSQYWKPETVLKAIAGHDPRIGDCADVGHWTRSGLDSVASLRLLEGHILTLHFKDVDENKKDVPWGTGRSNVRGMLEELQRQKYHGVLSMEYETEYGPKLIEALRQSIAYFDAEARRLAASQP